MIQPLVDLIERRKATNIKNSCRTPNNSLKQNKSVPSSLKNHFDFDSAENTQSTTDLTSHKSFCTSEQGYADEIAMPMGCHSDSDMSFDLKRRITTCPPEVRDAIQSGDLSFATDESEAEEVHVPNPAPISPAPSQCKWQRKRSAFVMRALQQQASLASSYYRQESYYCGSQPNVVGDVVRSVVEEPTTVTTDTTTTGDLKDNLNNLQLQQNNSALKHDDSKKEKKGLKRVTFALDQDFELSCCTGPAVVCHVASSIGLPSIPSIIQNSKSKQFKSKSFKQGHHANHHGVAAAAGFAAF